jgi:hypothetical protein
METDQNQPLTDDEISALLDGTANERLRNGVKGNITYQEQVEDARFVAKLGNVLYRMDCPPTQVLVNYHLGFIDPIQQDGMERHIEICASCQKDIIALEDFLGDSNGHDSKTDPTTSVSPQRTVATIHSPQVQIRGSAVRGLPRSLAAQAGEDLAIILQVSEDKVGVLLQGQLAPTPTNTINWVSATVELRLGDHAEPHVTTIDDVLQFRFQQIEATSVDVCLISTEGQIVQIDNIKLTEN